MNLSIGRKLAHRACWFSQKKFELPAEQLAGVDSPMTLFREASTGSGFASPVLLMRNLPRWSRPILSEILNPHHSHRTVDDPFCRLAQEDASLKDSRQILHRGYIVQSPTPFRSARPRLHIFWIRHYHSPGLTGRDVCGTGLFQLNASPYQGSIRPISADFSWHLIRPPRR